MVICFFFFNDTATTEIYTLSLHDALPIYQEEHGPPVELSAAGEPPRDDEARDDADHTQQHRSEEHTSELQSLAYLVCRLLLEKKKKKWITQSKSWKKFFHFLYRGLISILS